MASMRNEALSHGYLCIVLMERVYLPNFWFLLDTIMCNFSSVLSSKPSLCQMRTFSFRAIAVVALVRWRHSWEEHAIESDEKGRTDVSLVPFLSWEGPLVNCSSINQNHSIISIRLITGKICKLVSVFSPAFKISRGSKLLKTPLYTISWNGQTSSSKNHTSWTWF